MRKFYLLLLFLLLSVLCINAQKVWDGKTIEKWNRGDGTEENPFLIEKPEHLAYLSKSVRNGETYAGKYFSLTSDLDMGNKPFIPIGRYNKYTEQKEGTQESVTKDESLYFKGTFDGKYKVINNLFINYKTENVGSIYGQSSSLGGVGLFACTTQSTVIRNIIIGKGTLVETSDNVVGIIAGAMEGGVIENCINYGHLKATNYIGGIVGYIDNGIVKNCSNRGAIDGNWELGGIVGHLQGSGIVKGCSNINNITGTYMNAGGIVGSMFDKSIIAYCYNAATVKDPNTLSFMGLASGIVSGTDGSAYKIENCYIVSELSTPDSKAVSVPINEFKDKKFIDKLNNGNPESPFKYDENNINNGLPIMQYENNTPTSISENILSKELNYTISGRTISSKYVVNVYNSLGTLVASGTSVTLDLPGCYILKFVKGKTLKVILK